MKKTHRAGAHLVAGRLLPKSKTIFHLQPAPGLAGGLRQTKGLRCALTGQA